MVLSREEEFYDGRPRHPLRVRLRTGGRKDGTLLAREAWMLYDAGAYADESPGVTGMGAMKAWGPYRVPNLKIEASCVYTNNPVAGAFRGFGTPQIAFASESHLDMLAERLGVDPVELRLKNALEQDKANSLGQHLQSVGLRECIRRTAEGVGWGCPKNGEYVGRGVACLEHFSGLYGFSSASVRIHEDGTGALAAGAVDIGTGTKTMLCQVCAEELSVPLEAVNLASLDTDVSPYDWITCASRATFSTGNAVRMAAAEAKQKLRETASVYLEADVTDLVAERGAVFVRAAPERRVTYAELSQIRHYKWGGPIHGEGDFFKHGPLAEGWNETVTIGQPFEPPAGHHYAAQAAEVKVDVETGDIQVLRFVATHDVGRAINLIDLEGQVEGAVVQGLGYAVMEDMELREGEPLSHDLANYLVPT